jgi:hypothetical protein
LQNALEVTQQALRATQDDLQDAEAVAVGDVDTKLAALQSELLEAKVSHKSVLRANRNSIEAINIANLCP